MHRSQITVRPSEILLNFRVRKIAFSADISHMYCKIRLVEDHRRFWMYSSVDPIEIYELNTVSFGDKTPPFLALQTLLQLAED